MITAGHELTRLLFESRDFGLSCSLWLYTAETNRWKMVVATPLVESSGPIHVYQLIQGIISDEWQEQWDIHLYNIAVLRSNHSLVTALRSLLGHYEIQRLPSGPRPSPTVRAAKRISFTRIQDVFIDDALVYFVK